MISITILLYSRNAYEGRSFRAGSSHRHKSGSVSDRLQRAWYPHTDIHSRNSGSRSPRDAEAKAGRSNRRQKHTTRTPNANRSAIILSNVCKLPLEKKKESVEGRARDVVHSKLEIQMELKIRFTSKGRTEIEL